MIYSLKYLRSTTLGLKDRVIKISEFEEKTNSFEFLDFLMNQLPKLLKPQQNTTPQSIIQQNITQQSVKPLHTSQPSLTQLIQRKE